MLKSYEAMIENDQIRWLTEQPEVTSARVIVTILEETNPSTGRRSPSAAIAGQAQTLGDMISPIVSEEDWECLK